MRRIQPKTVVTDVNCMSEMEQGSNMPLLGEEGGTRFREESGTGETFRKWILKPNLDRATKGENTTFELGGGDGDWVILKVQHSTPTHFICSYLD